MMSGYSTVQAKLSGAKNVTLPMLRQKIDGANASAGRAQATDHCVSTSPLLPCRDTLAADCATALDQHYRASCSCAC